MAIDAVVTAVIRNDDGTAELKLGPRLLPPGGNSGRYSRAGQSSMTILNPPDGDLSGIVGTEVWGGSEELMVGDTKWAKRIGYTSCELVKSDA